MQIDVEIVPRGEREETVEQRVEIVERLAMHAASDAARVTAPRMPPDFAISAASLSPPSPRKKSIGTSDTACRATRPFHSSRISRNAPQLRSACSGTESR